MKICCYNFPEPKMLSSNCLFCQTNCPKLEDTQFTLIKKKAVIHHIWDTGPSEWILSYICGINKWQSLSVGPPLRCRLKYLNNHWVDCQEIWNYGSQRRYPENFGDPLSFHPARPTYPEKSKHLHNGLVQNLVDIPIFAQSFILSCTLCLVRITKY